MNSGFDPIEFIEEESMFQGSVIDEVSSDDLKQSTLAYSTVMLYDSVKDEEESYEIPKIQWDVEIVTNWDQRTKHYKDDRQKRFYQFMVPKFQEMKEVFMSNDGWSPVQVAVKDLSIEIKKSARGLNVCRSSGTIEWPAIDIFRAMNYFPLRNEWDLNCEIANHLQKVGVNAFISYTKTKKLFLVASRDLVVNYLIN